MNTPYKSSPIRYDCDEIAWQSQTIRSQWAESSVLLLRHEDPSTFFPNSMLEKLSDYLKRTTPDLLVVNSSLSCVQQAYLEDICASALREAKEYGREYEQRNRVSMDEREEFPSFIEVCDRNRLVLEIFATRARTKAARLQVAVAKFNFLKSKLQKGTRLRMRALLEVKRKGAVGMAGSALQREHFRSELGSINMQETEEMLLKRYQSKLWEELQRVKAIKKNQQKGREGIWQVGMVGYTNAGKTELMNRLVYGALNRRKDNGGVLVKDGDEDEEDLVRSGVDVEGREELMQGDEEQVFEGGAAAGGSFAGYDVEGSSSPFVSDEDASVLLYGEDDPLGLFQSASAPAENEEHFSLDPKTTEDRLKSRDLLFQTLDTTLRKFSLPGSAGNRDAILADSVGFIQNLPHHLFEAFDATIAELLECDLILHVRDISHPRTYAVTK